MAKCDVVVKGSVSTGEQYAMHTETQISVVQPEEGYYVVFSATQVINNVQNSVATLLGIGTNEYVHQWCIRKMRTSHDNYSSIALIWHIIHQES